MGVWRGAVGIVLPTRLWAASTLCDTRAHTNADLLLPLASAHHPCPPAPPLPRTWGEWDGPLYGDGGNIPMNYISHSGVILMRDFILSGYKMTLFPLERTLPAAGVSSRTYASKWTLNNCVSRTGKCDFLCFSILLFITVFPRWRCVSIYGFTACMLVDEICSFTYLPD